MWRMNFGLGADTVQARYEQGLKVRVFISYLLFYFCFAPTKSFPHVSYRLPPMNNTMFFLLVFVWFCVSSHENAATASSFDHITNKQSHANVIKNFFFLLQEPRWYHGALIIRNSYLWGE